MMPGARLRAAAAARSCFCRVLSSSIALTRAQHQEVRSFAQMLVTMHTASLDREDSLFGMINLTRKKGEAATTLEDASDKTVQQLKSATASIFDTLYVGAQVQAHQDVLDLIDDLLLPNAVNTRLKAEITTLRSEVQRHLTAAKMLRDALQEELDAGTEDAGP